MAMNTMTQGVTSGVLAEPTTSDSAPHTRLRGRWLVVWRVGWLLTLLGSLALFGAELPGYLRNFQHPLPENAALSPGATQALAQVGISLAVATWVFFAVLCVVMLASVALALALAWRRSDDWMALLVSLFLVSYVISNLGVNSPSASPGDLPHTLLAIAQSVPNFAITFAVILLFPNGRFAPRWAWILLVAITAWSVAIAASPTLWGGALFIGYPLVVGSTIACMVYRYRRASTPMQRQQTKWVVAGLATTLLANQAFWLPVGFTPLGQTLYAPIAFLTYQLLLLLVPITFFIALQRYRLYDIDAIINRALVYGSLTLTLIGVYAGCVIVAQRLVAALTGDVGAHPVVIVATTLLIAALARPLRARLQALVDRRFYRSKYNAAKIVAAFADTLRQEVELGALQAHLLETVERTVQPMHASVWLRAPAPRQSDARREG